MSDEPIPAPDDADEEPAPKPRCIDCGKPCEAGYVRCIPCAFKLSGDLPFQ